MRIRSVVVVVVVVAASLVVPLAGCSSCIGEVAAPGKGEGEGEGGPGNVVRLEVTPESLEMVTGEQATLVVVGREADGDAVDVGNQLTFASDDDAVATVDDAGNVVAVGAGETRLVAAAGSLTIAVPVLVSAPQRPSQLDYDDIAAAAGQAIDEVPQTDARGALFTIAPALPPGLLLDENSGRISGRVDVVVVSTSYVVTAENAAGAITASLTIGIVCDPSLAVPARDGDLPDLAFVDDNDDGVDGLACGPLFVAPTGNDENDGSRAAPLLTITTALQRAATARDLGFARDVYVAAGRYTGALSLQADVNVYGGYDGVTWQRSTSTDTVLAGGNPVLTGRDLAGALELQLVQVEADDAFFAGDRSTAVLLDNAGAVTLRAVDIAAGNGQDGARGQDGVDGNDGGDGTDAEGGCVNTSPPVCVDCGLPTVGLGSFSFSAGASGGDGGAPGFEDAPGENGDPGAGGSSGGIRGFGGDGFIGTLRDGDPGQPGDDGADGDNGPGGLADGDGGGGTDGDNGGGGGGGGGGAGGDNVFCNEYGGAGGGGAAGGRAGTGASGGSAGGPSIALQVSGTTVATLSASSLRGGTGGDGGDGGRGGNLGPGGFGGDGGLAIASASDTRGGNGGRGGDGGKGGLGGHGGGGGGGSSLPLVVEGGATVDVDDDTDLIVGAVGRGGSGPGQQGQQGRAIARDDR